MYNNNNRTYKNNPQNYGYTQYPSSNYPSNNTQANWKRGVIQNVEWFTSKDNTKYLKLSVLVDNQIATCLLRPRISIDKYGYKWAKALNITPEDFFIPSNMLKNRQISVVVTMRGNYLNITDVSF